ncbi:sulfur carrier protein ThiS [Zhaonella formicivorans]|uniref:sulfur carrier protein ThiS n=1 Tax=Zhaonella formicivorans TaxID=2528593 RepID=UPI0010F25EA5|nr:sulfur carrier protein ThiS [Zhaonella formicivorans]
MLIYVNEQETTVPENFLLVDLLRELGFSNRVAIWINNVQILQRDYITRQLQENDRVRIVKPLAGG